MNLLAVHNRRKLSSACKILEKEKLRAGLRTIERAGHVRVRRTDEKPITQFSDNNSTKRGSLCRSCSNTFFRDGQNDGTCQKMAVLPWH